MSYRGLRLTALSVVLGTALTAFAAGGSNVGASTPTGPTGVIRLATDTPPDPWDPALATPNDPNMLYYQGPYDFLVNTDGEGKLVPGLATSWEQDLTSLTLTLRDDVTFHDGTPFDAEAVKINIEHFQNDGIPPNKAKFATVESVEVLDTYVVKLNFSAPTPQLIHNLARHQGMMASPAAIAAGDTLATSPVGTGGWLLDEAATVANSVYVFHANPDYWNPEAQLIETVEIYFIPDQQARTNALLSGDVDYAVIDAPYAAQVEAEGFAMNNTPAFPYYLQILDREGAMVPALADQRVRQAMFYAIDQESFYEFTNFGAGTPSNQWTIPGEFGFNDDFTESYDLDKAKALMAEAGVDGFELTVPSYGPFDGYNEAIVGFLAEIGIDLKLEAAPTGNLSGASASGQYAASIVPAHEVHPNDFYSSRIAVTATQNPFDIPSPEIDALMATITGDDAADEDIYEQMSMMVAVDASVISIGTINCMSAWDADRVSGVEPWLWTCGNVRLHGLSVTEG